MKFFKNALLILLIFVAGLINAKKIQSQLTSSFAYDIKATAKSWLPTPVYTALKKWFFAQPKYIKLQKKYVKEKYIPIIKDPMQSAQALRTAIQNNTAINQQLKNNPNTFLFGASSSSYQVEGGLDTLNATAQFNDQRGLQMAGEAIDFWNRYKTDIPQMKSELGINAFRISIAWERVQPTHNTWDEDAIMHYVDIIKTLKAHSIEPIVVLHHYTIPIWFGNLGGFEKNENNTKIMG